MAFNFSIDHVVQVVACCIRSGGAERMNIMKLLKLLYIVDRESFRLVGYPVTGDTHVAMKHGPVLSQIYDLTSSDWEEMSEEEEVWQQFFRREGHDLLLVGNPAADRLSQHDVSMVHTTMERYGHLSQFELRDRTHEFPEWRNNETGNSSRPIPLRDLLEAVGRQDDYDVIKRARDEEHHFADLFAG